MPRSPLHLILATAVAGCDPDIRLDRFEGSKSTLPAIPSEVGMIQINLSLASIDFREVSDSIDAMASSGDSDRKAR